MSEQIIQALVFTFGRAVSIGVVSFFAIPTLLVGTVLNTLFPWVWR